MRDIQGICEIWKTVRDYEGLYEVSNLGRIKSMSKTRGKILKPYIHKNGYAYVSLCKDGKRSTKRLHKYVALEFIGNPPGENYQVNHKNGIKYDNEATNLEWMTQSENMLHAYENGLEKSIYLSRKVIRLEDGVIFESMNKAAKSVNGHHSKIALCSYGQRKKHKGFTWSLVI